jgi:hypothetical protein
MSRDFSVDTAGTPAENTRGLECRRCGCWHFYVIYTRQGIGGLRRAQTVLSLPALSQSKGSKGGKLIRRRECRHCGKRFTTWESAIG